MFKPHDHLVGKIAALHACAMGLPDRLTWFIGMPQEMKETLQELRTNVMMAAPEGLQPPATVTGFTPAASNA